MGQIKKIQEKKEDSLLVSSLKALTSVLGIYGFFILFNYKLESVLKTEYAGGQKNTAVVVPVVLQSVLCITASSIILYSQGILRSTIKTLLFEKDAIKSAVLFFFGMYFTNVALQNNVSIILMTMIKSSKTLVVMFITYFFPQEKGKSGIQKLSIYFSMVITAGLLLFNFTKMTSKSKGDSAFIGMIYCFIGAICDSFASRLQVFLRNTYSPSGYQVMFYNTIWIGLASFLISIGTGELNYMLALFKSSPEAAVDQFQLVFLSFMGLNFIYLGVGWIGAIFITIVSTTRKIFTVLISIVLHGHTIDAFQAWGIALVSIGLLLEMGLSVKNKLDKQNQKNQKKVNKEKLD